MGIRMNLFGFALLRADYAIPLDRAQREGLLGRDVGAELLEAGSRK